MMLGKLQRTNPTLRGHFPPAYLVRSNKLRAYILFFIYEESTQSMLTCFQVMSALDSYVFDI